tara:strand:- start:93 stop:494 length:402 start_codon:yes stop_codon:yes gene_type:complete
LAHTLNKIVCGFHCDAYGHVNNARYLEFFEEARWAALNDNNIVQGLLELQLQFFIVNINVDFKQAVLPDDKISITTAFGEVKRKTMSFMQTISRADVITTKAEVTFVLFDTQQQRAVTITDDILSFFKPLMHA